ncbi:hypothetical protein BC827DRAFT_1217076 [Russula dissimulans]|nr:hypothetical protein BC827DRAFT_1217076 [Russula dissimulans]
MHVMPQPVHCRPLPASSHPPCQRVARREHLMVQSSSTASDRPACSPAWPGHHRLHHSPSSPYTPGLGDMRARNGRMVRQTTLHTRCDRPSRRATSIPAAVANLACGI